MYVLIVEDDHNWVEEIEIELQDLARRIHLKRIATESEFRQRIQELVRDPPAVVVMDLLLTWASSGPMVSPLPKEFASEGLFGAGLRCIRLLREHRETAEVPVVLYSVISSNDVERRHGPLPPGVTYIEKSTDAAEQLASEVTGILDA